MQMTKIFGTLFILSASVAIGLDLTRREKEKLSVLSALCELIKHILRHVKCFESPIDSITSDYKSDALDRCGFGESMRSTSLLCADVGLLPIDDAARREFENFSRGVGRGYRDEELKRCEYYLEYFESALSAERENFERRRAQFRYLPLLCGAAVVIILI